MGRQTRRFPSVRGVDQGLRCLQTFGLSGLAPVFTSDADETLLRRGWARTGAEDQGMSDIMACGPSGRDMFVL